MTTSTKNARAAARPTARATRRPAFMIIALAAGIGSVLAIVAYANWADGHNAAYYAAVEVGRAPIYQDGHYQTGAVLGGLVVTAFTLMVTAAARLFLARPVRRSTRILVPLSGSACAVSIVAGLLSPLYAVVPALLAICLAAALVAGLSSQRQAVSLSSR